MITGINHITIAVRNLEESFSFYRDVLEFEPLVKGSRFAYFLAGELWFCLDQDPDVREGPLPEYTHFAFDVSLAEFNRMKEKILHSSARIWRENVSEGPSIYFLDPNGHKLEIHVGTWATRLDDLRRNPWESGIEFF